MAAHDGIAPVCLEIFAMERLGILTGLIWAGGASVRMGQDKALVRFEGTPLLRRVYDRAAVVCSEIYVMTPRVARYQEILPDRCQFLPESFSESITESATYPSPHGPVKAFHQALQIFVESGKLEKRSWVLLLSCDLPLLNVQVLQDWKTQVFAGDSPQDSISPTAWVPRNAQGWWEPLCGFYRADCLPALNDFVTHQGRSFQHWLDQEWEKGTVKILSVPDSQMLWNINTPDQLHGDQNDFGLLM